MPSAATKTREPGTSDIVEFVVRALAAVVGGYGAVYGLVAAASVWSPLPRATSAYLFGSLMLLPYLGFALWAFAARSPVRAWAVPLLVMAGCAAAVAARGIAA